MKVDILIPQSICGNFEVNRTQQLVFLGACFFGSSSRLCKFPQPNNLPVEIYLTTSHGAHGRKRLPTSMDGPEMQSSQREFQHERYPCNADF